MKNKNSSLRVFNKIEFCNSNDKDVPKLKCGHPLPCPYHTILIIINKNKKFKK